MTAPARTPRHRYEVRWRKHGDEPNSWRVLACVDDLHVACEARDVWIEKNRAVDEIWIVDLQTVRRRETGLNW
jgi:hypothetical protein